MARANRKKEKANQRIAQMNKRTAATLSMTALAILAVHSGKPAQGRVIDSSESAISQTAQQGEPTAEQLSKNIQVLKGLPASQTLTVMHLMRTALGVKCDYCHIAEFGKYWMDDKPPKQVARRMITMVSEINKANFGGRPVVTCNTCHRGQIKPAAIVPLLQGEVPYTTAEGPSTKAFETMPSVEQILEKYYRAIGGQAAAQKITSRVSKISLLRGKLVNAGTPKVEMIPRGETWAADVYQKAPNKYLAVMNSPNGIIYQGFNGTTGWVKTPERLRQVTPGELARVARTADFLWPFRLKETYSQMSVTSKERINDHEVFVIDAIEPATSPPARGHQTTKLFFDSKTGLLIRRTILTETPFGLDPEQTDFQDYKSVDGVKLPFTVITSYLDDKSYGTTRKYHEVKQNVPIDDSKFEKP
jgi:photosynthetic reaction center cytochrome c subunit